MQTQITANREHYDRLYPAADSATFQAHAFPQDGNPYDQSVHKTTHGPDLAKKRGTLRYRSSYGFPPDSPLPVKRYDRVVKEDDFGERIRHVEPIAFMDAPKLEDDFYRHSVDWQGEQVAAALGTGVHLRNTSTHKVHTVVKDADLPLPITVQLVEAGRHVAIGRANGDVDLWDNHQSRQVRRMPISAMSTVVRQQTGNPLLYVSDHSGGLSALDLRVQDAKVWAIAGAHSKQVCGLSLSTDGQTVVTGADDDTVKVWDVRTRKPKVIFDKHKAAIKAIAFCPWNPKVIATGGGTDDHTIRIWNSDTGQIISEQDAGTQITGLLWNKHYQQLISTHGHGENKIKVWQVSLLDGKLRSIGNIEGAASQDGRINDAVMSSSHWEFLTSCGNDEVIKIWDLWSQEGTTRDKVGLTHPWLKKSNIR